MSWYYAENNERRGPIEEAAFQALVASGTIRPETLVWREGFNEWVPYRQVQVQTGGSAAVGTAAYSGEGGVTCSQCGRTFAASDLISLSGRLVCANCKPLVVQQMIEGTSVGGGGAAFDPNQFLADLRARGGYRVDIGHILSRAWATVTGNFWPCVGITLLLYLILLVAQQIPCLGLFLSFPLTGMIFGGLFWYFIKQLRGEPATINDAFAGFTNPHIGPLALASTVQTLLIMLAAVILIAPGVLLNLSALQHNHNEPPIGLIIWVFVAMLPIMYLSICWLFCYPLVIDKRLGFWDAMELSRKVVNMNFWGWVLLMLVNVALSLAGVLALCVGIFVVLPITFCGLMVVYEDIFSPNRNTTAT